MKVILDIPENSLTELEKQAKQQNRSRKNYMESVLIARAQPAEVDINNMQKIHFKTPPNFDSPKRDDIDDEPLSFAKMEKSMTVNTSLFQQYLNGMADLVFPDEKEDYERKIRADPNLSEKQISLLIKNLRP